MYTLSGTVFFDYNGNGLRDEREPPIESVPIRVAGLSTTSGPDGSYSLAGIPAGRQQVYIQSPTPDPAAAFRYINRFLGWVDIPAYEINGVSVPAQHLADTEIQPISQSLRITLNDDQSLDMALMQGFLTLPFMQSQVPEPFVWNYFDIIGYRLFDDVDNTYWSTQDGVMLSYDGRYNSPVDQVEGWPRLRRLEPAAGVGDSHTGLDYLVPIGTFILSGAPTSYFWFMLDEGTANLMIEKPVEGTKYETCYGHLQVLVVELDQKVYRGQIVGLAGDRGIERIPQLHFHIAERVTEGWYYVDPNRYSVNLTPLPENFWGSSVSYWTIDNRPQFP